MPNGTVNQPISPEISSVLTSSLFAKVISGLEQKAADSRKAIHLTWFSVTTLDTQIHVAIGISVKHIGETGASWSNGGQIIAALYSDSEGELKVNSLYFMPPPGPPGGASVGNR